jgi:hypothetical protein
MRRHESLRTAFPEVNDEPVQRVYDFEELEFELEHYSKAGEDERGRQEVIRQFIRPFDFSRAPLLRVGILEYGDEKILLLDMHHIITDDSSILVFMEDLKAMGGGGEPEPLAIQYKDYAAWQHGPEQQAAVKKQEQYWLDLMADQPPRLVLPAEIDGEPGTSYLNAVVPGETAAKLGNIAKEHDATSFMAYLAIYNIFLSRLSGLEDIVIGTLTAGRGHDDLTGIIGMFVNTLVLRNKPASESTFKEFLSDVRQRTLEAFDNQDYQFDEMVDRIVKKRAPGQNPLFDIVYSYYGEHREVTGETPAEGETVHGVLGGKPKFTFTLYVTEKDGMYYLSLIYDSGQFKEETIERYYGYIDEICTAAAENPDIKLKDIMISHELEAAAPTIMEEEQGDFGF